MNIELRHLRYFIAVAEELHFGCAAARLNISQPPLSLQIRQLEQQIGAQLLYRSQRSVQLTPAGDQYLLDARQILNQVDAASVRAARLHQGHSGELRLGFTSSAPFVPAVSRALSLYRQRYPDVLIQTREMNTRSQIAPLQSGELDLGLMRNTTLPRGLAWQFIHSEPLRVLLPELHPLTAREVIHLPDLDRQPLVFFDPHVGTGLYDDIFTLFHRYNVTPDVTQEVGEAMTIIGLVAAGLGVSILPASFERVQLPGVVWRSLAEPEALSELWLVWPERAEQCAPVAHFVELMTSGRTDRPA